MPRTVISASETTDFGTRPRRASTVQGGLVPNKFSGVGTYFGLLVYVVPGPNKQRAFEPSTHLAFLMTHIKAKLLHYFARVTVSKSFSCLERAHPVFRASKIKSRVFGAPEPGDKYFLREISTKIRQIIVLFSTFS
jgi:hypothetical protein